jgi:hypothetical protein
MTREHKDLVVRAVPWGGRQALYLRHLRHLRIDVRQVTGRLGGVLVVASNAGTNASIISIRRSSA